MSEKEKILTLEETKEEIKKLEERLKEAGCFIVQENPATFTEYGGGKRGGGNPSSITFSELRNRVELRMHPTTELETQELTVMTDKMKAMDRTLKLINRFLRLKNEKIAEERQNNHQNYQESDALTTLAGVSKTELEVFFSFGQEKSS